MQDTDSLLQATSVEVQTGDFGLVEAGDKELIAREWVVDKVRAKGWVPPKAFNREWKLRVRGTSCYCSTCRVGHFDDCMVANVYPALVGMIEERSGSEKGKLRTVWTSIATSLANDGAVASVVFSGSKEGEKGGGQPRSRGRGQRSLEDEDVSSQDEACYSEEEEEEEGEGGGRR